MASWADVAGKSDATTTLITGRLEFHWKVAKKGRLRPASTRPTECTGDHCQTTDDPCQRKECLARIQRQLLAIESENIALESAFQSRLLDLNKTYQDIWEHCTMDGFDDADIDASRLAFNKAMRAKVEALFCECPSCKLSSCHKMSAVLSERLSAAQHRLKVLKEFRIANDLDAVRRTSSNYNNQAKYFTAVGSSKAKGVRTLKPKLQMQSSYDVAALTTNSMVARPLKVAWKDKPKPNRTVAPNQRT